MVLYFHIFELPSRKDALSQAWLIFAQGFLIRCWNVKSLQTKWVQNSSLELKINALPPLIFFIILTWIIINFPIDLTPLDCWQVLFLNIRTNVSGSCFLRPSCRMKEWKLKSWPDGLKGSLTTCSKKQKQLFKQIMHLM